MKAIRPWPLVAFAFVAGILGWIANALAANAGFPSVRFPWSALVTMGVMCAVSLGFGFAVWRSRTGRARQPIDPLVAARTLVLGQACAHAGALIAGWHTGVLAGLGRSLGEGGSDSVNACVSVIVGGLIMIGVGIAVEFFCRIPPEEGDPSEPQAQ
ncbi:DUF3180 domain-containing protein [Arthrobacter sp. UM1]|uniref:DUF3180 domain-containing protein n=1 Tax=Arthrobacter sp. UM1 TaxID=2766776 RepID=UPI001CF7178B|nr:DUF3180 domain-containing protein [Arthrobacter sp. UM1]MCB4208898.1 DUF3180 domain-containing protein [Arthrobacter sp. UM1]